MPPQEVHDGKAQMRNLTNQWYQEVRAVPSESDEEVNEFEMPLQPLNG